MSPLRILRDPGCWVPLPQSLSTSRPNRGMRSLGHDQHCSLPHSWWSRSELLVASSRTVVYTDSFVTCRARKQNVADECGSSTHRNQDPLESGVRSGFFEFRRCRAFYNLSSHLDLHLACFLRSGWVTPGSQHVRPLPHGGELAKSHVNFRLVKLLHSLTLGASNA